MIVSTILTILDLNQTSTHYLKAVTTTENLGAIDLFWFRLVIQYEPTTCSLATPFLPADLELLYKPK